MFVSIRLGSVFVSDMSLAVFTYSRRKFLVLFVPGLSVVSTRRANKLLRTLKSITFSGVIALEYIQSLIPFLTSFFISVSDPPRGTLVRISFKMGQESGFAALASVILLPAGLPVFESAAKSLLWRISVASLILSMTATSFIITSFSL